MKEHKHARSWPGRAVRRGKLIVRPSSCSFLCPLPPPTPARCPLMLSCFLPSNLRKPAPGRESEVVTGAAGQMPESYPMFASLLFASLPYHKLQGIEA